MWPFSKPNNSTAPPEELETRAHGVTRDSGISTRTVTALKGMFTSNTRNSRINEESTYATSDLVHSCVGYIGKQVSQVRFNPIEIVDKSQNKSIPVKHKLLQAMFTGQPNPYQTWNAFNTIVSHSLSLYGNAFISFEKIKGRYELWAIQDPKAVSVILDEDGLPEGYLVGEEITYSTEEMLHIKSTTLGSGVYGLSPLSPLFDQLAIESYATTDIKDFYKNSLVSTSLLTSEQPLTKKQAAALTESIGEQYKISKGRHSLIVLPNNLSVKGLRLSPKESLLLESLDVAEDRILGLYSLHKMLVGGNIESYTHNLSELMNVQFASAIRPVVFDIQAELEAFLQRVLKKPNLVIEVDFSRIPEVKLALLTHMESARSLYISGVGSLNESRKILGLPRIEDSELADQNHLPSFLIGSDLNTIQNLDAESIKKIQESNREVTGSTPVDTPSTTDPMGGKNTGKKDKQ